MAYYSLIFNTREHDRHPEWRMLTDNGQSRRERGNAPSDGLAFASKQLARYGLLCPNNEEYFEFTKTQINELLDYCTPDGLFYDMPVWPAPSLCYCDSCKKRWADEVGGDIPLNPPAGSEMHTILSKKRYEWMGEWAQKVTDYTKSVAPRCRPDTAFAVPRTAETGPCTRRAPPAIATPPDGRPLAWLTS